MCNPAAVTAAEELHARSKGYSTSVQIKDIIISRRQGRAEAVYYWLGLANERLAQQLGPRGVDVREHHHTKRALELYQQQLTVTQEHGGRAQQAKAHGNLGNAHILKGGYARASELIQRALDMFQSLGDTASAAVAVQTLTQLQLAQALRLRVVSSSA